MANNAYTQDVILDADGKPVFDAFKVIQKTLGDIQKTIAGIGKTSVQDAKKWQTELQTNLKLLKQAQSDLRALQSDRKARTDAFSAIEKQERDRVRARQRANADMTRMDNDRERQRLLEAKIFYAQEERDRKAANKRILDEELRGLRIIAEENRKQAAADKVADRQRIQSARELRAARVEAAKANITARARGVSNIDEARQLKADSDARLVQLRREREAASHTNTEAARGLAQRIELEKTLGRQLEANIRTMQRSADTLASRMGAAQARGARALAPLDVQETASRLGATQALAYFRNEQRTAQEAYRTALATTNVSREQLILSERNLAVANARVVAAKRLVAEEIAVANATARSTAAQERAASAEARRGNQKTPLQNILSPGYAAAAFARTSIYGAAAMAAYGTFNAIQQSIVDVVKLDDELARLQAIAAASDNQMQQLKASIIEIGTGSRYSVVELAKISQSLAQAGVEASGMADALKAVTQLATSSGSTPDEAVNLVTAALGAFQLQASEASRIADVMTEALNRTRLTVAQVGLAIQYVGATAFEQNIDLDTLLATSAAVAQAGVRSGSTIGTGMRQFLVDLQTPTEKLTEQFERLGLSQEDVNVKTRGLIPVLETLRDKGFGSAQAYASLETRAAAFYLVAKNNVDIINTLQTAFAHQGASIEATDKAMDSLSAQGSRFGNNMLKIIDGIIGPIAEGFKDILKVVNDLLEGMDVLGGAMNAFASLPGVGLLIQVSSIFKSFGGSSSDVKKVAVALEDATAKVDKHQQAVGSATKEIARLQAQQGDLRKENGRVEAETVTLTSRFEGLAKFLGQLENKYDDLVNAMKRYSMEENKFLAEALESEVAARGAAGVNYQTDFDRQLVRARADSELMRAVTPQVREALRANRNQDTRSYAGLLNDEAKRLEATMPKVAETLYNLSKLFSELNSNANLKKIAEERAGYARAASTELGGSALARVSERESSVEALVRMDRDARKAVGASLKTSINADIRELEQRLANVKKPENRKFVEGVITSLKDLLTAIDNAVKPTKAEQKEAEKAQKELEKRAKVTRKDVLDVISPMLPAGASLGSGYRTPAEQDALHRQGVTKATSKTSSHVTGIGQDIRLGNMSNEAAERLATAIRARLQQQGIEAQVIFERGKGVDGRGTGRHIHIGVRGGTRFGRERTAQAEDRFDSSLYEAQTSLNKTALTQSLRGLSQAQTQKQFEEAKTAAKNAVMALNTSIMDAAKEELARAGLVEGDARYDARISQVKQEIAQNLEDYREKVTDSVIKMAKGISDRAAQAYEAATRGAQTQLDVAQASASGLDLASNRGKVPEYTKALTENRVAQANENLLRVQAAALPAQIAELERKQSILMAASSDPDTNLDTLATQLNEVATEMEKLRATKQALDAQLAAGQQAPVTLADGLRQAADAFRLANNASNTFSQDVALHLGDAIDQVNSGFSTMFQSMISGTSSALGAFRNFAMGIIDWIGQIAAQLLAKQVVLGLLNLVGLGSSAAGAGWGGGGGLMPAGTYMTFKGGTVGDDGFLYRRTGGEVTNGDTSRDSVKTKLAKGEWVIQKKAVDSVGNDFMANLNRHGSKAIDNLKAVPAIDVKSRVETNVYVVPPEEQVSLGPNDVRVIMRSDMLSGEGRQLIKQIARD